MNDDLTSDSLLVRPSRPFGDHALVAVEFPSVSNRRSAALATALAFALGVGAAGLARADGAFPDELQIFVPANQPSDLVLAANFGLIESTDNGQTWVYVCEAQAGASGNVNLYQMGPDDTLLGDSFSGLFVSTDLACTWSPAGGALAPTALSPRYVYDAAFDPNTAQYVLALSNPPDGGSGSAIYPSTNDAATFGPPLYVTPANLSGIEFSSSSPGLVYVTGNDPETDGGPTYFGNAFVMLGVDGGASWGTPIQHPELNAELAGDGGVADPPLIGLAQVDPVDPQTAYFTLTVNAESYLPTPTDAGMELALTGSTDFYLAVTHDSGQTIQLLFRAPEQMTSFLRSAEGTLYVGTRNATNQGGLFAAPLDGGSFQVVHQACADGGPATGSCDIHVRALAERSGLLYACGDNWVDHMALGTSSDQGVNFTSLLQFIDISDLGCPGTNIEATCGTTWSALQLLFGIDAGTDPAADAGSTITTPTGGCGCGSAEGGAALLALLSFLAIRRRRVP
jgi:MYXO-CTERM domain-containing protein